MWKRSLPALDVKRAIADRNQEFLFRGGHCPPLFCQRENMRSLIRQTSLVIALMAICSAAAVAQKADNEYQIGAILWTQTSAEKAALSYQAFSLARLRLDQDFRTNRNRRMKRALIVDVDETVLDNSRYQAKLAKEQKPFESKTWTDWCSSAQATALPGA